VIFDPVCRFSFIEEKTRYLDGIVLFTTLLLLFYYSFTTESKQVITCETWVDLYFRSKNFWQ